MGKAVISFDGFAVMINALPLLDKLNVPFSLLNGSFVQQKLFEALIIEYIFRNNLVNHALDVWDLTQNRMI